MDETKLCPYCGEPIQKAARKCKWCGEWLNEDNHSSYITCPTCGEQIPEGSSICPLCKEPISNATPKHTSKSSAINKRTIYFIAGGLAVVALLIVGVDKYISYQNDKEYQESIANSPYSIISKNLDEAVAKGQKLNYFLRDEKNVDALKNHFGEETYSLILALSSYSDEPLTSCDPEDSYAGGYAWSTSEDKGRKGCRLILGPDKLGCKYYYDGMEVDAWGNIETNSNWKCEYYKDDFNEDVTDKPYIELWVDMDGNNDASCFIRLDNYWGVAFMLNDFRYFNQILIRNNDTNEVWSLPIDNLSASEAVLRKEGHEKFIQWFQTAKSITISMTDEEGGRTPYTATLYEDKLRFYPTFMHHVMKKRISDKIFLKHDFN